MNFQNMIQSLESFGLQLPVFVAGVTDEDAMWKPPSQNWSILEVVCHLVDEERNDFRKRVQLTLEQKGSIWPGINPELTAIDEKFNQQNFGQKVEEFVQERADSVRWLKSLESPDWFAAYEHPHLGTLRAGDLLASWAAHDLLHIRQMTKRKFELIKRSAEEFDLDYAGEFT